MTENKKRSTGVKIFAAIMSIILTLLLMVVLAAGTAMFAEKSVIEARTIENIIKKSDIGSVEIGSAVDMSTVGIALPEDATMLDLVQESINAASVGKEKIDSAQAQELLDKLSVNEFMSEKLEGYIQGLLNDMPAEEVTHEEIKQLIESNTPIIEESLGYKLDTASIASVEEQIAVGINEIFNSMTENITESVEKDGTLSVTFEIVKKTSAPYMSYIAWGAAVLLLLLLALVNMKISSAFSYGSIAFITVGAVLSFIALSGNIIEDMIQKTDMSQTIGTLIKSLTEQLCGKMLLAGLILLGIGALMVVLYAICGMKKAKKLAVPN